MARESRSSHRNEIDGARPDRGERRRRSGSPIDSSRPEKRGRRDVGYGRSPSRMPRDKRLGNAKVEEPSKKESKIEPNYGLSGLLAKEANSYKGIALKYSEPREARKPSRRFRLYVFKDDEQIDMLHIHRHSAYLLGRERKIADIPIDHPSCSSQHAVIQYRSVQRMDDNGNTINSVAPYIIDLDSTNGTYLNSERIEPTRYYELKSGDTLKFAYSTRIYTIIAEDEVE